MTKKRGLPRRKAVDGRTRVYYSLARKGRTRLDKLQKEWERIRDGVSAALDTPHHG